MHAARAAKAALFSATILAAPAFALADSTVVTGNNGTTPLPTGQFVTPQLIPGASITPLNPGLALYPNFVAGEAVRAQLSPDGTTLAIICAGQNSLDNPNTGALDVPNSAQFVFLYNVAGANAANPVLQQVLRPTNTHVGLVWAPNGNTLYAAGGRDDVVYVYTKGTGGQFVAGTPIALGHGNHGIGLGVQPNASGLAISADGATLVVANNYNESISVIDTASGTVRYEHDLRPYAAYNEGTSGVAGGEYPLGVAIKGTVAYVGSFRDREVVAVDVSTNPGTLVARIKLDGNANGLTLSADNSTLYVAEENADEVAVIATATNTVTRQIDTRAPAAVLAGAPHYTGAAPFSVTVGPDGSTLYVVNDGSNSVAVIPTTGANANTVAGLIPTAYAPKGVVFSQDGTRIFIVNGKSDTGPNPGHISGSTSAWRLTTYPGGNAAGATASNEANSYQFQLEQSTLLSAPMPTGAALATLTNQVATNNFYNASLSSAEQNEIAALRSQIKHVIYIIKENRTFDQILGDLGNGSNGDPTLTVFGRQVTPNFHRIASQFVTLDNFTDAADGSMDGWSWGTRGRVTTTEEITQQINYAFVNRGLSYESEGANKNIPVGRDQAGRDAATGGLFTSVGNTLPGGVANFFPGENNVASTDAPFGVQQGFLHDAILQAGLTVRDYGWFVQNVGAITTGGNPPNGTPIVNPYPSTPQVVPLDPNLTSLTDVYFRGFDQNYPDLWRFYEWQREFNQFVSGGNLPSFEAVRFSHDHMGSFGTALAGVNYPEAQQADDDYTVGRLVEAVAASPYASSTLIFITEDDTQDGPDHTDSHRAPTYVVGPYVRNHAIVSNHYSQVSVLRTIEDILGTQHVNLNTAFQRPMLEVFDTTQSPAWTYHSIASPLLKSTSVLLSDIETGVRFADGDATPAHDAAYWAEKTRGFDFTAEDRVPTDLYNRVLWEGLMGDRPYPAPAAIKASATR